MSLLSVLDRVAEHNPEEFVAPVPQANMVQLFSLQNDIPYRFNLQDPQSGWWKVLPRSKTDAVLGNQVLAHEKFDYLEQLPRFYVIAVAQVNETTWLCTPHNLADAEQRGWRNGQPKHIYLTSGNINQFSILVARKLDQILLFEMVNSRLITTSRGYGTDKKSFLLAQGIIENIREQERQQRLEQERKLHEQARLVKLEKLRNNAERYAEHQLELSGAKMTNFLQKSGGFEVTWEYDGATFTMPLLENLQVQSAGICLAGTDQRYGLSQIVHVMQQARVMNRFDMDEELWL